MNKDNISGKNETEHVTSNHIMKSFQYNIMEVDLMEEDGAQTEETWKDDNQLGMKMVMEVIHAWAITLIRIMNKMKHGKNKSDKNERDGLSYERIQHLARGEGGVGWWIKWRMTRR